MALLPYTNIREGAVRQLGVAPNPTKVGLAVRNTLSWDTTRNRRRKKRSWNTTHNHRKILPAAVPFYVRDWRSEEQEPSAPPSWLMGYRLLLKKQVTVSPRET